MVIVFLVDRCGLARLVVVGVGFASGVRVRVFGCEYVACAAAPDVRGAVGVAADDTVLQIVLALVFKDRVERVRGYGNVRLNILPLPRLNGIRVLGHVTGSAAARRHHGCLEGGRLQVFGHDARGLGTVYYVAGAAAA